MTTARRAKEPARYRVANPRGLPPGSWIIRAGEQRWREGDDYDGPVTERFVRGGFIVEASNVES